LTGLHSLTSSSRFSRQSSISCPLHNAAGLDQAGNPDVNFPLFFVIISPSTDYVPEHSLPFHHEKIFSLNAALMSGAANDSAEENDMDGVFRKLACCMVLLTLVGTASAGFAVAGNAGTGAPVNAGSSHGDRGLLSITGESGTGNIVTTSCYFPIYNLPAYYVCIMVCKIGGGGDRCAPMCEASLSICT
jgi:hypothetical protein